METGLPRCAPPPRASWLQGDWRAKTQRAIESGALFGLSEAADGATTAVDGEDYTQAMEAMARLRQPVDAFFDNVTVNAEDAALRENRLNLLSAIGTTLSRVADFSKIEG